VEIARVNIYGEMLDLDLPYTAIGYPMIAAEGQRILFVGAHCDDIELFAGGLLARACVVFLPT